MLDVAVILVTHDSAEVLPGFLESLAPACSGLRWQLVVADNASGDDSLGLVRDAFPDATIVETGRQPGLRRSDRRGGRRGARRVGRCSSPTPTSVPPRGRWRQLLVALRPGIGIVGPRIVDDDGSLSLTIHRAPTVARALSDAVLGGERARRWVGETVNDPAAYESAAEVDWLSGAFLAISTSLPRRVGRLGPAVLPLQRGDRLRAAGPRRRLAGAVRTVEHRGPRRRRQRHLALAVHDPDRQSSPPRLARAWGRCAGPCVHPRSWSLGELLRSFRSREPSGPPVPRWAVLSSASDGRRRSATPCSRSRRLSVRSTRASADDRTSVR